MSDLPAVLELLSIAEVPVRVMGEERGLSLFVVDLTSWRLRFSDTVPFIVVRQKDLKNGLDETWNAILEVVIARDWERRLPVIIVEGNGEQLKQKAMLAGETWFNMAVLDDWTVETARDSRSTRYAIINELLTQIPRKHLLPYETSMPVTGSAFFGRESEIRRLTQSDSSFAISGARRIGKTSLLLETQRRTSTQEKTVLLVCSTVSNPQQFIREMIRALRPQELRHLNHYTFAFTDFLRRMPNYVGGRITLFLDETDQLVEIDKVHDYSILASLRQARIATNGRWKFVFVGSTTLENECANRSSPLYNMVNLMPLAPFSLKQTAALITLPFESVRIRLKNSVDLINRIYRETGGHPNLIQHYCILLAELIDAQQRDYITCEDLDDIYCSTTFRHYVLRSFEINTAPIERLIVYLMTTNLQFTQADIDKSLKRVGVVATLSEIGDACSNLERAAILRKRGRTYQFSLPILPLMLEHDYDLEYLVAKALEELRR